MKLNFLRMVAVAIGLMFVVWLPLNSPGSVVYRQLAAASGHLVRIRREDDGE